ncbi:hypothetical protein Bca52824_013650 [Brassica carinata]|uniref:Zinc knuckle CX2CX4HX4C domain-containing protein n=1 Tax=Brassica carinata TaxID=52824 RepID=A0A8X8B3N3_BRACI|nr:hypothetical protein Bca52824_013650 [Brassica carinata]
MTIRAVGKELGKVEDCVPTRARVRVLLNGLKPLEMVRDILLPSGQTKEVEFAYEKLEKHCFNCFSLTHEKNDCPLLGNNRDESRRRMGISQNNTMTRLDDRRRKYEEKKRERPQDYHYRENSTAYARKSDFPEHREDSRHHSRHHQSYAPVTSEYRRGREDNNSSRRPLIQAPSMSGRTGSRRELPPSEHPSRELETRHNDRVIERTGHGNLRTSSHDSGSKSIQSPGTLPGDLTSTDLKRSLPQREEGNRSGALLSTPLSADKRPAKERLSLPSNGKSLLATQGISTGSSRLQDIEIQYLEETINPILLGSNSRPSGSRPPGVPSSPLDAASPIRTLSEDRRHVSLCLGPLQASSNSDLPIQARLTENPGIITRSAGRKKASSSTQKKRVNNSPIQGVSLKKRRVAKTQNSPKRRTQAIPPNGNGGGLSLSWKHDVQVDILSSSPNIIDTSIILQQKSMFVSFIYGPPRAEDRADFWNKLMEIDHRPILIHLNQTKRKKRGLFRFDRRLKDNPEIKELVDKHWTSLSYESVLSKICRIRRKLMEWTKAQSLNSKELIMETQEKLEEALSKSPPDPLEIGTLTANLEKAYTEEEVFWKQRSRIQWLHSGDRNSKFFHAVTRERRTINKFSVLENSAGQAVFEEEQIVSTITDYYNNLFSAQQTSSLQVLDECLLRCCMELNLR